MHSNEKKYASLLKALNVLMDYYMEGFKKKKHWSTKYDN